MSNCYFLFKFLQDDVGFGFDEVRDNILIVNNQASPLEVLKFEWKII